MAVVLEECLDYEPSEKEVSEYAEWLGMDLTQDLDLLWIAREGLKAPLPAPWKACLGEGDMFYFNLLTGESEWDHPVDSSWREMYRRAKAHRDAPVRVVTIHGSLEEGCGILTVRCCGSLSGEQLVVLKAKTTVKFRWFRVLLEKHLEASTRRVKIMTPDGRLLDQGDDRSTLATVLGIASQGSDNEQGVVLKEEQCHDSSGRPASPNSYQEPVSSGTSAEGSDNEQVVVREEEQCHDSSGRLAIPNICQASVRPGNSIENRSHKIKNSPQLLNVAGPDFMCRRRNCVCCYFPLTQ